VAWLPTGEGLIIESIENKYFAPYAIVSRMNQARLVPPQAPAGQYQVVLYAGDMSSWNFVAQDVFTFSKSATDCVPESTYIGSWTIGYDWGCGGDWEYTSFTFYSDGTFENSPGHGGVWIVSACNTFEFWYPNGTYYWARYSPTTGRLEGDSLAYDGDHGCWFGVRE